MVAWVMAVDTPAVAGLLNVAQGGPVHLMHHIEVLLLQGGQLEALAYEIHALLHQLGLAGQAVFPRPVFGSRDAVSLETHREVLRNIPVVPCCGGDAAP